MAASTGLNYPLCVEWITELPYEDEPRQTSISFNDSECFLMFNCDHEKEEYRLTLCYGEIENMAPKKPVTVTTYIQDKPNDSNPTLIDISLRKVDELDNVLWCKSRDDVVEIMKSSPNLLYTGKFTIICLFHGVATNTKKATELSKEPPVLSSSWWLTDLLCNPASTDDLKMLSYDLVALLKDETLPDIQLKCKDRTFFAHKCILAARSKVFAAMFRSKMSETDTGVADIQHMDPEVLEMLLQYMYSGIKPNLSEDTALSLYEAADMYDVRCLQKACSEWIMRNLTPDNYMDVMKFADRHSDEILMARVAQFIAQHKSVLIPECSSVFKKELSKRSVEVLEKFITSSQHHVQNLSTQPNTNLQVLPAPNNIIQPIPNNNFQSAPNYSLQPGSNYTGQPAPNNIMQPIPNNNFQSAPNYSLQPGSNYTSQPALNNIIQPIPNNNFQSSPNYSLQPGSNYTGQPAPNNIIQPIPNNNFQSAPNYSLQSGSNYIGHPAPNNIIQPIPNNNFQSAPNYSLQSSSNYTGQPAPNNLMQLVPNNNFQSAPNYSLHPGSNYTGQSVQNNTMQLIPNNNFQSVPNYSVQPVPNNVMQFVPNNNFQSGINF